MKVKNVLVYPGDTKLGLEIIKSLKFYKDIELYSAAPTSLKSHFPFLRKQFLIPSIYNLETLRLLNDILIQNKIDFIYPADDKISYELVKKKEEINADIISQPLKTLDVINSKSMMNDILKLDSTQNLKEKEIKKYAIVGCISDRERGLLYCTGFYTPKESKVVKIESNNIFSEYAKVILNKLELYGGWSFILGEDVEGTLNIIKIIPRTDTQMVFYRILGVNFPLLSLYEADREKFEILCNDYEIEVKKDNNKILLPYKTVYVDLDDTLIIKKSVNIQLIQFLYQCHDDNKKIVLITKHKGFVEDTLESFKISINFFDEIIHLVDNDEKSYYITEKNSIFIDDSYHERKNVYEINKIPTFDICMVEGLIDVKNRVN